MGIMTLLPKITFLIVVIAALLAYVLKFGATYHKPQCTLLRLDCPNKTNVEGTIRSEYKPLQPYYQKMFDDGEELYSCLAVYKKGELVVDLCGGNVTTAKGEKRFRDVVQNVFSSTKVVVMITAAMLVDRGLLKYEDPIAKYWPEFGEGGKEKVTVSDLLAHASGVSFVDATIPWSIMGTDSKLSELAEYFAKQKHNFGGKRTAGYHALMYGSIVNEIVRRVDPQKRTIAQFATDEIIKPLDVQFYFGLPEEQEDELYNYFPDHPMFNILFKIMPRALFDIPFVPSLGPDKQYLKDFFSQTPNTYSERSTAPKIFGEGTPDHANLFNSPDYRRVQHLTGLNGFSQAKSLAKMGRIMTEGTVDGIKFLSQETIDLALTPLEKELDVVFSYNLTRCVGGFGVMELPEINTSIKGWTGFGGSVFLFDTKNKISFGYVPGIKGGQFISVDSRITSLMNEFYRLDNNK